MNGLPYYKAYPRDFIEGTIGMPFETKCAYRVVLDIIYMQNGHCPDDPRYISGLLGCSVRKWNSIRTDLIKGGKLKIIGEFLTNDRAIIELESLRTLQDKNRENRSGSRKNNDLQKRPFDHTESEPDTEEDASLRSASSAPGRSKPDLDDLETSLRKAAGLESDPSPGLFVLAPILSCLDNGADLDMDVLPTIKALAQRARRPPRSWEYFAQAIMDAHASRTSARSGQAARASPGQQRDTGAAAARRRLETIENERRHRTETGDHQPAPRLISGF